MIKKLIEVALPLEEINKEAAREKSIRHGHPSTLHLWWARRPLAAARAVLFAQLVDDPSSHPEQFPTAEAQNEERQRLFTLLKELVKWENINNERLLGEARAEIAKYAPPEGLPPFLDPFAGGGSIPLEAQRLGLEAHASDLNPVAVLINKALIEIPPRFANRSPVSQNLRGLEDLAGLGFRGASGLAADVRHYGAWMREQAAERIGHLYPPVTLPAELGGGEATVIAWLWARTVPSPNPAAKGEPVPLVKSFWLSTKKGKEAWVEPVVAEDGLSYHFEMRTGKGTPREGTVNRKGGTCLLTGVGMPFPYIRQQGRDGNMKARLMAIVAEGKSGRVYLSPNYEHEGIAKSVQPTWKPDALLPQDPQHFNTPNYGLTSLGDLFTNRQLVALTTFSDLVGEARGRVVADALAAGWDATEAEAYGTAVATYLAFAVDKAANIWSAITTWMSDRGALRETFARQAIPMAWDFAEANPFSDAGGNLDLFLKRISDSIDFLPSPVAHGHALQQDATQLAHSQLLIISCDPPYYDNISYADLSDFFYIWLRRSLGNHYPSLFNTLLVPKTPELVASPYRFQGGKAEARQFFEDGLGQAFESMRGIAHLAYPLTIYYAFKQIETGSEGETASTGWETMLTGLMLAGFSITGTWPMRTESAGRIVATGSNALASSIILVCRPRPVAAPSASRREFLAALRGELRNAVHQLQQGAIPPVDLQQASIGPGMAIYSRYSAILEADGTPLTVRTALQLINQELDTYLSEQEGEFDGDTRWAITWFEQYGFGAGPYGEAETLCTAKNTSMGGLVQAGIIEMGGGKVRLLPAPELAVGWKPAEDGRLTVWELTHQLGRAILDRGGELAAAEILAQVPELGDAARDLAYRLYAICERKGWSQEALLYNVVAASWVQVGVQLRQADARPQQGQLF